MAITILVTLVLFIVYSFYELNKEKTFTKRQKVNWSFVLAILPVTGSMVYLYVKHLLEITATILSQESVILIKTEW